MQTKPIRVAAAVTAACLFLDGCAGYRLGSTLPPDIKTIFIPTFLNQTPDPLIEVEATNRAISEFQKDGTLQIASASTADVILEVTIRELSLTPLRYAKADKTTPNEYRMTLKASFVLKRAATGKVMDENPNVIGEATFPYAGDMMSAKRTALPRAAEDLGRRLVQSVVEAW